MAARRLGDADQRMGEHLAMLGCALDLDPHADEIGRVVEDAVGDVGELGVVSHRRAEQQAERGPVARDELKVGGETHFDAFTARLGPTRCGREPIEQLAPDVVEQLNEQRPLRREMLIEDGLRDAGREGDVVHRRGVKAARREHVARHFEELTAALLGGQAHQAPVLLLSGIS